MKVAVVGLGYVGLPLAVALARKHDVVGFDVSERRVAELRSGLDSTNEVTADELGAVEFTITNDPATLGGREVFIVTVPTPIDEANRPDFDAMLSACAIVGPALAKGSIVVFESTVDPGVTEEICGPALERSSGLKAGVEFKLGYSPERINPGDREHSIRTITTVVAGQDADTLETLAKLYGSIVEAGIHKAASIKVAEAAKAIENTQRDLNIALKNEVAKNCHLLGIRTRDVLDAARTKWNFLPFEPGLVGGHCIGVDPYYLSHVAQQVGHDPQVILAGRQTNDGMGAWIADALHDRRRRMNDGAGRALVLGLTFKENVPDLRNSRSFDLVRRLQWLGYDVEVADPVASAEEIQREHGLTVTEPDGRSYALVVGAVAHRAYRELRDDQLAALVAPGGTLADLKGMWRGRTIDPAIDRWTL
jgi:UDP-N-acetyl-D-galactosamine dehydrogenase